MNFFGLFINSLSIKMAVIVTVLYVFLFPLFSSMLGSLGNYAGIIAFMAVTSIGLLITARIIGVKRVYSSNVMIKTTLVVTVLYWLIFTIFQNSLLPFLGIFGQFAQYIVVFVFYLVAFRIAGIFSQQEL